VTTVRITRPRHPFEGQLLAVLGSMRRHGARELLVVLPDGSKRLVPASWTDAARSAAAARGRWAQRRTCWVCPCWFPRCAPVARTNGSRLHENRLPGRMIVQPVQLSLLPEQVPAPLPELIGQLPEDNVAAAVALLAAVIARAQTAASVTAQVAGDE